MSETTTTNHQLTITKQINAPIEDVFDAWIVPDIRKQWWRGAPEMNCDVADIDARPGGRYRLNMKGEKNGQLKEFVTIGEFVEIDRPNRLVFTWAWEHERNDVLDDATTETLVTVVFQSRDRGTLITLTHERFTTQKDCDGHEQGWTACLESLSATAAKLCR